MSGTSIEIEGTYLPITKRCMYGTTFKIEGMYVPSTILYSQSVVCTEPHLKLKEFIFQPPFCNHKALYKRIRIWNWMSLSSKHHFIITKRCMYGATFEIEEMYLPLAILKLQSVVCTEPNLKLKEFIFQAPFCNHKALYVRNRIWNWRI